MTQGDIIHGFRLLRKYPSGDFKGTLYAFEHEKSGAQVFWFSNGDAEAMGVIGVRTPASDDTGVAHVLEHMLFFGSRKYPGQDAWRTVVSDAKADINAFTSNRFTSFRFKNRSPEKFRRYLDFWLDHLYHPLHLSDPRLFASEIWRYVLTPDGKLSYNGIVYNEIRMLDGVHVRAPIVRALMPDTPDAFYWGGRTDALVHLRPENVVAFHQRYYHPSNTGICLYGDIDIEDTLRFLDATYFANMKRRAPAPFDDAVVPPKHTLHRKESYEVFSPEQADHGDTHYLLWLLDKDAWFPNPTEMAFLAKLLFKAPSPIHRLQKRDGFHLEFATPLERFGRQRALRLHYGISEKKVLHALETLRGYHFQQKDIVQALEAVKKQRHIAPIEPKDAEDICHTILTDFAMGYDLADDFHAPTDEMLLQMHLADGSLDRFVQTCLVETPPSLALTLTPSYELHQQRLAAGKEELERKQAQMTADELAAIRTQKEALLTQETPVVPSAAPIMRNEPRMPTEEERTPVLTEETMDGATILHADVSDEKLAGKCYIDMSFDGSHLPAHSFSDLFFLKEALSHLPTLAQGVSFHRRFSSVVHGYTPESFAFRMPPGTHNVRPVFTFHFTCAVEDIKKALGFVREMLTATSFANRRDVEPYIFKAAQTCREASAPHKSKSAFVKQRVMDTIHPYAAARKRILCSANRSHAWSPKFPRFLAETVRMLFCREGATIFFAAAKDDVPSIREQLAKFLLQLPKSAPSQKHTFQIEMQPVREGFFADQPLQYIAAGGTLPYDGSIYILASLLLTDYLFPRVRQAGGAYEIEVIPHDTGALEFYSGRDPHLSETLDTFAHAADFVRTLDVSKERLAAAIDGVMPPEKDKHGSLEESLGALRNWNCGMTEDDFRQEIQKIRETTIDRLRAYAPAIEDIVQNPSLCVIGNEDILRANADRFQTLQPW